MSSQLNIPQKCRSSQASALGRENGLNTERDEAHRRLRPRMSFSVA